MDEQQAAIAALTARVDELERTVALLGGPGREPVRMAAPPPPPPRVELPMMPEIPAPALPVTVVAKVPAKSLEDRLGAQVFNLVGIVALLAGAAWALKLAIEHGYLGPVARVLIGIVAGVGLVLWSETFRRKGLAAFSYSLKAVGSGALYLSLWAGFHLYGLLPDWAALSAMVLVTAWNAYMAWAQDAELLAAYALLGGFATPLLLSTGGNHEGFLFTYIAALDLATVLLLRVKPWRRLVLPVFGLTVLYFIGWYSHWFHRSGGGWDGQSWETATFALVFGSIFAVLPLGGASSGESSGENGKRGDVMVPVLLPLGYGAFEALALYSVFQDSMLHSALAWLMVALAAVYLGLMRLQKSAVSAAVHLALAVVFLTAALPLKASGHTLTVAWLVEGLALYWISTRFETRQEKAAGVLRGLAAVGYGLGLTALVIRWFGSGLWEFRQPFFNANLGSAVVALAAVGGAVWLAERQSQGKRQAPAIESVGLLALASLGVLLVSRELLSGFISGERTAFVNADFATALLGLGVLGGVAWWAWSLRHTRLAGAVAVSFNLLAILSVEREIGALWHRSDANLQRSLAISGFLMLYGSVLLAVGFCRRSEFTRWQALILLLFTICKVFLYDTLGLSAGYRVVSFLGLGLVLMGVSLAYQKDWLGLKEHGGGEA